MSLYEHVFLARQDISAQQVDALLQDFRTIIEAGGGSIGKTEYWGVRSLSFRIKKNRKESRCPARCGDRARAPDAPLHRRHPFHDRQG
jgi:ribosomal protein S6